MMRSFLKPWTVHTRHEIRLIRNFQWITWLLSLFIIVVIIKSTPCNHFQEYNTCVLSCYLQEPFTWLQESKRADRSTTKMSLSTRWVWHALQLFQPMEKNSSNEHSTQCHFIFHHWIVPNLYVCVCMRKYLDQGVCRIKRSTVTSDDDLPHSTLPTPGWISACLITSNFTHKRSCKMSTQHNVLSRRTRLHSLDEKDSRSFTVFS